MSVAKLSARELGLFVALQIKTEICPRSKFTECLQIAEHISVGNCKAWAQTYSDQIYPVPVDDIERAALEYLSDKTGRIFREHFGPIAYNCVSNDGESYFGSHEMKPIIKRALDLVRTVENRCEKWQDERRREDDRQRENDAAYSEVEPLPRESMAEVAKRCIELGFNRVIIAEYHVDESDIQTDYFGHRTAREVVIGFGQGKRESFKQLRTAAARFEPTKQLGPGRDVWTARVVFSQDIRGNGQWFSKGQASPWHREENDSDAIFTTEAGARAWASQCGEPSEVSVDGQVCKFEWSFNCESIEHRENWSMGGGNYLGSWRHRTGWKVRSFEADGYKSTSTELIEVLPFDQQPAKQVKPAKKKATAVELLERSERSGETYAVESLKLQHGKTVCVISKTTWKKGRASYSVATGRSFIGKTFWSEETLRGWYRSTAMAAMVAYALEQFEADQPKQEEPPAAAAADPEPQADCVDDQQATHTIDLSDIDALAWL